MHTGLIAGVAPGAAIAGVRDRPLLPSPRRSWSRSSPAPPARWRALLHRAHRRDRPAGAPARGRTTGLSTTRLTAMTGRTARMPRNWAGLERTRRRTECSSPSGAAEIVTAVERARAHGPSTPVKMVGTGHSFTGIAAPEHTMLRPRPAARRRARGGPRRRRPSRPGRHPAQGAQPHAGAARALAAQHGRHRRADPGRRCLHRHPRQRRATPPGWPPSSPGSSWSPAPARCSDSDQETRSCFGPGPDRARRPRRPHRR